MMSATVAPGSPAAASAQPAGAADSPVSADSTASADFMALLLLLMGVGTPTPQPEGQPGGERADEHALPASEPPAGEATAGPTPVGLSPGNLPVLLAAPAMGIVVPPSGPVPMPNAEPGSSLAAQPDGPVAKSERPISAPRPLAPPAGESALDAVPAAEPQAPRGNAPMEPPASRPATHQAAPAGTVHHALHDLEAARPEDPRQPEPPLPTKTEGQMTKLAAPLAGVHDTAPSLGGHAAGDRGERQGDRLPGQSNPMTFAAVVDGAAGALAPGRGSHAVAEVAPATPAVEPRAIVEQIVQAARVVVNGDQAEMHVRLDPPALGTVHVTAESRGGALDLTISADRPETQALLARALPDIQQTLADRGLGSASVSIASFSTAADGRRMPDRRPSEPRERPTSQPSDRRRTPSASRHVGALDITI